ncbi:FG-GAP-like repeat-containing protein [Hymenobacter sp. GOD-10R]|uniref:FG-GAP-like repeat-containing protein n=1 Tax=Hymenobacter sp. GOD-10R TaxID=3093922 RepID=UPI002D78C82B|nr:FG-GAP-like repeat-containing protein [Hymenobacter sp. GOD-10R]WRQ28442.1 FG-GAP-like repeat-containing protein [Hymenobacter sp. GOD-10R]
MRLFSTFFRPALSKTEANLVQACRIGGLLLLTCAAYAQTPVVTSLSPGRNARSAPRTTDVSATFSQPLRDNPSTRQALKVFSAQTGGKKAGTTTVSGSTLSFNPDKDFKAGETVYATVTAEAQGANTTPVAPQLFQFTTATSPSPGIFNGGSDLPAIDGLRQVLTGDVDGDGDLDLLTLIDAAINVRLNNGNGTFGSDQAVVTTGTRNVILRMGLSDLDADGDLDLITWDLNLSVSLRTYLNNGNGTFTSSSQPTINGSSNNEILLGDVDADGDQDLLISSRNNTGPAVNVQLNNGLGIFSATPRQSPLSGSPSQLTLGDVDADGDLDLFVADYGNTVSVYLNDARGSFTSKQSITVLQSPTQLAVGDVDGDGDLDLLAAASQYDLGLKVVSLRLNDGTGTFSEAPDITVAANPRQLALGDVDGDGDLDLLTANDSFESAATTGTVSVRLNNGSGTFSGTQDVPIGTAIRYLAIGDLDNDGDLDLIGGTLENGVHVRLNQTPIAPTITSVSPASGAVGTTVVITGTNFQGVTRVTFNGVPEATFVVNSPTQITVKVPVGASTGPLVVTTAAASSGFLFTVTPSLQVASIVPARNAPAVPRTAPITVSFDQALNNSAATLGSLKMFSTQVEGRRASTTSISGNSLTFKPNTPLKPGETVFSTITTAAQSSNGQQNLARPYIFQLTAATAPASGLFGGNISSSLGPTPQSVAIGDVDGDGDLDLLSASVNTSRVSVRLNDGSGLYTGTQEVATGQAPASVVLGDVDSDGDLDLLTGNNGSGTVSVRLNNGNGLFSGSQEATAGPRPNGIALGDIDGDGDLDLLVANYNDITTTTSIVTVLLNDGSGTFTSSQTVSVRTRPLTIALGDVDGDGDLDFVTTSSSTYTASVRLNDGTGSFSGTQEVTVGSTPYAAILGDVDKDGDLDLLALSRNFNVNPADSVSMVHVRLNDGSGIFSGTQRVSVGQVVTGIALGDADGDGDLDLFAPNSRTNRVRVCPNDGTGTFSLGRNIAVGVQPEGIALGDLDGNGTLDFVTVNYGNATASVRLNQMVLANAPAHLTQQVSVYPNPAHTSVRLSLPAELAKQRVQVQLVNTLGQTVLTQTLAAQATPELTLAPLAAGVYSLQIRTNQGVVTKRLVVE